MSHPYCSKCFRDTHKAGALIATKNGNDKVYMCPACIQKARELKQAEIEATKKYLQEQ